MYSKQIEEIRKVTALSPKTAIVLGSGLGALADKTENKTIINYNDISDMPVSTAPSHKGQFVFGTLDGKDVVLMQGRVHLYEGYSPKQVVMPIHILKELGVENLILTNAAGGINTDFNVGDFMLIRDHISCFVESPLIGQNDDSVGTRFPDMSNVYDKDLRQAIKNTAKNNGIKLQEGVYTQLTGPHFETPSEIKMLSLLGSDAVGMSTVIEAIAAKHCGLKVCAVSLITNFACGILDQPLSSEEVNETAQRVAPEFERLITEIVKTI